MGKQNVIFSYNSMRYCLAVEGNGLLIPTEIDITLKNSYTEWKKPDKHSSSHMTSFLQNSGKIQTNLSW